MTAASSRSYSAIRLMSLGLVATLSASCGHSVIPTHVAGATNSCPEKSAYLAIGDGYQRILCGCQEPEDTTYGSGKGELTCTVAKSTVINFVYQGTLNTHQIVNSGGASFPSSPISGGPGISRSYVHTISLGSPGIYRYADTFDGGVTGQIVVQ